MSVKIAFAIGAFVFLLSVLFTVFTTSEYPPEDMEEFEREKKQPNTFFLDMKDNVGNMPKTMVRLGVVQFFSWFAFFTMWSLATPALTEHVFNTPSPIEADYDMSIPTIKEAYITAKTAYTSSANKIGSAMGTYGLTSMIFALLLTLYTRKRRINRKFLHMASLILGGFGFISMYYLSSPNMLYLSFALIGIAWASILSMPYAMLSGTIDPKKMGVFMGLFNMFIVIPQIIAALGGINFTYKLFGEDTIYAMVVAGLSLIIAGLSNFLITNPDAITYRDPDNVVNS